VARGTHCVIGAGFAGLGATRALLARGVAVHVYEAKPDVGGNWLDGVYDSTHLITSRNSTGFPEFPLPRDLPDFPHWKDLLEYLRSYADEFGLREHIRFGHEVTRVVPAGVDDGTDGWLVTYRGPDGEQVRRYAGVVIANGHHWDKFVPRKAGTFTGAQIHVKDYKRPEDLVGPRVLVVGAGVSACDLAVEASRTFGVADISMRRTHHFIPKTLFGKPVTDLNSPWMPGWLQRTMSGFALRVVNGPFSRYGMPAPDHKLFAEQVTINSQLLYAMRHGAVRYRPDIERFDGRAVRFVDGRVEEYDGVVWATGYRVTFPFLDRATFQWTDGVPRRVCGMLPERVAGLYVFGLMQLRGGAGPMLSRSAELLADLVRAQERTDHPISLDLARVRKPDARFYVSVPEMTRQVALERRLLAAHGRLARLRGRVEPVGEQLDGDLVRATAVSAAN
jgi:cation diffusion facilitator CzcD-associated flavoprotein CzcO